jgi:MFS transporter, Spinster family, sphingosine-1-phosphate transporter
MFTAPFFGFLADRYSRKTLIILGATIWSGATLLTATTHNHQALLFRRTVVGIGEASFATIASPFLADLFGERQRGRVHSVFALANPAGTASGYVLGGSLGQRSGWRSPVYIAAIPGFLLAIAFTFIREPERGRIASLPETARRETLLGLSRNGAYRTATMAWPR